MNPWLVSRRFDLLAFTAPAIVALALVPLGPWLAPSGATPLWGWVAFVLLVDVAHVWSTLYRTYLDPQELRRRTLLYVGAPLAAYGLGVSLASISFETFWRGVAYLAVFHFVRQQYGWVRLYGRQDRGLTRADRHLDAVAVYAATVYPLLWWHAHLPRSFVWFTPEDFVPGLPVTVVEALTPVYALVLVAFFARQAQRGLQQGEWPWGKTLLVATTAACWGVGIVAVDSDWAFTVTNVIIHGVPYVAFLWVYGRRQGHRAGTVLGWLFGGAHWGVFLLVLGGLAYGEELLWDRSLWHDRGALFPVGPWTLPEGAVIYWMPLLAVPQITHYILDGFIWRRRASAPSPATDGSPVAPLGPLAS